MYKHIAKDGNIVDIPNQAKNAIDHTIKNNERVKRDIIYKRNDHIGELVEKGLYDIKGASVAMPNLPRKK